MIGGTATIVIQRPAPEVFAAVTDIARMGEWSPECTAGRWVAPATGPDVGARFEGDNVAAIGPITLKRWTTTSEITAYEPDSVFEFVAEGFTTWRYDMEAFEDVTRVTESFRHPPYDGWQRVVYGVIGRRQQGMVRGMEKTLARIKATLEA